MKQTLFCLFLATFFAIYSWSIPAFPGAEGFGAAATGGRGGNVYYVTSLLPDSSAGTLQWAVNRPGPKYILFKVSGLVSPSRAIVITGDDMTIAGQTSPGGVIVRGLMIQSDQTCEQEGCTLPSLWPENIIIRNLRSRAPQLLSDGDGVRCHRAKKVILDHISIGNANDEAMQLSMTDTLTVQNCLLGETLVEGHDVEFGGMLINYSDPSRNWANDHFSIHHNMWNRISGRYPELSRENFTTSSANSVMSLEISCNTYWDAKRDQGTCGVVTYSCAGGGSPVYYLWNNINNYQYRQASATKFGMFSWNQIDYSASTAQTQTRTYFSGNKVNTWESNATARDYKLIYCCNDFDPVTSYDHNAPPAFAISQRHPFPSITYTDTDSLLAYSLGNAGAFPRDSMDRRLMKHVQARTFDPAAHDANPYNDALHLDFSTAPIPPLDTDNDGMPDYWETANGLSTSVQDHNETNLSIAYTGIDGYTNLECYLNRLQDSLVTGVSTVISGAEAEKNRQQALNGQMTLAPNPFNPWTRISIGSGLAQVNRAAEVRILNIHGSTVDRILSDSRSLAHGIDWNAHSLAGGVYIIQIRMGNIVMTRKATLVR